MCRCNCGYTDSSTELFLYRYVGNKCCIRDVAGRFNHSESTLHRMVTRALNFFEAVASQVIRFPSDLQQLCHEFEQV